MARPEFVHLHVHTEYSLLDGANRISDLVRACQDDEQPAIAITDHGNMFGAVELYQKCRSADLKPILGCEVYIARESRLKPHNRTDNPYTHLTLLARNEEGYRNLLKLASISYVEGYHYRPRIDREVLSQYANGISCLSGCLSGELNRLFLRDQEAEAERTAIELRDLFGPEHFWLELQRNGIEIQDKCNEAMVRMHQRLGIPLVATNDIHYMRHEDCMTQDVLLCINTGAKREDEKRFKMDTDTLFFRTREEMGEIFRDLPEALKATLDVAEQVDVELEFGKYHLPVFTPDTDETPTQLFERLCNEGVRRKYGAACDEAMERLTYEKGIIRELGFESYFLIVWDLIRWARDHGIPVGPGRGSAAGSIVAYALDITMIDPLEHGLIFERFLNPSRVSMPDIDIDFCKEGRERVLHYTRERYGTESVAQIVTFGTMASRTVVRDVGRVLDVPLGEVNRLAKMIPAGPGAPPLQKALDGDKDLVDYQKEHPELEELFNFSVKLEGLARHISTHAAGVVIADKPIDEYVPLCTHDGEIATQWPAGQLEELGLLKMDYLGLRTLTILDRALDNIRRTGHEPPDLENLPEVDERTFQLLIRGDTLGVFQLESEGMRKLLARLRPDCFADLVAVLALYRPGPLESGMDEMFARRKHGLEEVDYPHPSLEDILEETYGCIVYQEQVMRISSVLANFSMAEADNLRKAMGKKKPEIMAKFSEKFLTGAAANGCKEAAAQEIWDNIVKFGGYGFNKSHSAAYALITWRTAFLKANFRRQFLAANMSCEMHDSDKIKDLIDDAQLADITMLPPSVEHSEWEFLPEGDGVRFGFGAIKGTGPKAIDAVLGARKTLRDESKTIDLHNLSGESDPAEVTRLTWEALIKAGAFDHTGANRGSLLGAVDSAVAEGARKAADRKAGQASLFDAMAGGGEEEESQPVHLDASLAFDKREALRAEHEVLGFYLTGHPLEEQAGIFSILSTTNTRALHSLAGGTEIILGGLIVGLKEATTRTGKKMARFRLEDLKGGVPVTCFPRTFEANREKLIDDALVLCRAKTEETAEGEVQMQVSLILDEVLLLEEALERFEGGLVVELRPQDEDTLHPLSEVLRAHQGPRRLFFEVEGKDGLRRRVRAGQDQGVRISPDLVKAVGACLGGPGRVKLARF
ncbi:MAG: DNA polymerase III subunit alpha [Planctomycetota bacterium]